MIEKALVTEFERALFSLDRLGARRILLESGDAATRVQTVEQLVVPALERIGAGWESGRVSLSQVYMSGRICEELVNNILPPADPLRKDQPKMAIAVLQDHHLLGKRIIVSVLQASGFGLFDYGQIEAADLVSRVQADGVRILLLSTLMLGSALQVRTVRAGLAAAGWQGKIVVGGAPFRFDDRLWQEVGADAVGHNIADAIAIVNVMMGGVS